jgi:hypothetical protein
MISKKANNPNDAIEKPAVLDASPAFEKSGWLDGQFTARSF